MDQNPSRKICFGGKNNLSEIKLNSSPSDNHTKFNNSINEIMNSKKKKNKHGKKRKRTNNDEGKAKKKRKKQGNNYPNKNVFDSYGDNSDGSDVIENADWNPTTKHFISKRRTYGLKKKRGLSETISFSEKSPRSIPLGFSYNSPKLKSFRNNDRTKRKKKKKKKKNRKTTRKLNDVTTPARTPEQKRKKEIPRVPSAKRTKESVGGFRKAKTPIKTKRINAPASFEKNQRRNKRKNTPKNQNTIQMGNIGGNSIHAAEKSKKKNDRFISTRQRNARRRSEKKKKKIPTAILNISSDEDEEDEDEEKRQLPQPVIAIHDDIDVNLKPTTNGLESTQKNNMFIRQKKKIKKFRKFGKPKIRNNNTLPTFSEIVSGTESSYSSSNQNNFYSPRSPNDIIVPNSNEMIRGNSSIKLNRSPEVINGKLNVTESQYLKRCGNNSQPIDLDYVQSPVTSQEYYTPDPQEKKKKKDEPIPEQEPLYDERLSFWTLFAKDINVYGLFMSPDKVKFDFDRITFICSPRSGFDCECKIKFRDMKEIFVCKEQKALLFKSDKEVKGIDYQKHPKLFGLDKFIIFNFEGRSFEMLEKEVLTNKDVKKEISFNILDRRKFKEIMDDIGFALDKKSTKRYNTRSGGRSSSFRNRRRRLKYRKEDSPNRVYCKYENIIVKDEDFDRLEPEVFLNDTIMDYYIKILRKRNEEKPEDEKCNCYMYSTSFYPLIKRDLKRCAERVPDKSIKVFDKDYLFIPINKSLHWTLCVVCFPGKDKKEIPKEVRKRDIEKKKIKKKIKVVIRNQRNRKVDFDYDFLEKDKELEKKKKQEKKKKFETIRFDNNVVEQQKMDVDSTGNKEDEDEDEDENIPENKTPKIFKDEPEEVWDDICKEIENEELKKKSPKKKKKKKKKSSEEIDFDDEKENEKEEEKVDKFEIQKNKLKEELEEISDPDDDKITKKCLIYCDSLGSSRYGYIVRRIRSYLEKRYEFENKESVKFDNKELIQSSAHVDQQDNCSDCGVFVLSFLEYFSEKENFIKRPPVYEVGMFQEGEMRRKRREIQDMLRERKGEWREEKRRKREKEKEEKRKKEEEDGDGDEEMKEKNEEMENDEDKMEDENENENKDVEMKEKNEIPVENSKIENEDVVMNDKNEDEEDSDIDKIDEDDKMKDDEEGDYSERMENDFRNIPLKSK